MKTTALASALMLIGVLSVLRAVFIVARGSTGRFRADPWITLLLGFTLILLGRVLLEVR